MLIAICIALILLVVLPVWVMVSITKQGQETARKNRMEE